MENRSAVDFVLHSAVVSGKLAQAAPCNIFQVQ
jgi:hypothetical protein